MTIYVDIADGKTIPILATSHTKVKDILAAIRNTHGIPTGHTRLIFGYSRRMNDDDRLMDCNIETGDTLTFFREQLGGKPVLYLVAPEGIEVSVELSLIPQSISHLPCRTHQTRFFQFA